MSKQLLAEAGATQDGYADAMRDAANIVAKQPRDAEGRIDGDILWRELKMRAESAAKLAGIAR